MFPECGFEGLVNSGSASSIIVAIRAISFKNLGRGIVDKNGVTTMELSVNWHPYTRILKICNPAPLNSKLQQNVTPNL